MAAPTPGIIPKAALVTGRIAHKPSHIPGDMTNAALDFGGATHHVLGEVNNSAREAVTHLNPRGPAKLLLKWFDRVDLSAAKSAAKSTTSAKVFWAPLSEGVHGVGQAAVNPLIYMYAKRAGFPEPGGAETLSKLTHSKGWPAPEAAADAPAGGGTPPAAAAPAGDAPPSGDAPAGGGGTPPAGDAPAATGDTPAPAGDSPAPTGDAPPPAGDKPPAGDAPPPAGDKPPADAAPKPA